MDVKMYDIGERIFERRKQLGLTQDRLSEVTALSTNQISNIENGYSAPTIETLLRICSALEVTPDYLLLGINREINNETLRRITEAAALITDKQQNLLYEFISLLRKVDY